MNVSDAIRLKRSTLRRAHVRKFTDQPLPEATILAILNAGRRAHSSKNTQRSTLRRPGPGHGLHCSATPLSEDPAEKFQRSFDLGRLHHTN